MFWDKLKTGNFGNKLKQVAKRRKNLYFCSFFAHTHTHTHTHIHTDTHKTVSLVSPSFLVCKKFYSDENDVQPSKFIEVTIGGLLSTISHIYDLKEANL